MPQVHGIWNLGLEGTDSTHHSDSEIQTDGCSISTHMSVLTSVRRKKAHCMGRSYLEMPHNTPTQEYSKKKKFISQNLKGKKSTDLQCLQI